MTDLFRVGGSWQLGVPKSSKPQVDKALPRRMSGRINAIGRLQLPGYMQPTRHGGFYHQLKKPIKDARRSIDPAVGRKANGEHECSDDDEAELAFLNSKKGCRCGLDVDRLVLPLCEVETRFHSISVPKAMPSGCDISKTISYLHEKEFPIPLSRCEAHDLFNQLPVRYQGNQWEVAFDSSLDGHSMRHFYRVLAGEVETQESKNTNIGVAGSRASKRHSYHTQQQQQIELMAKETSEDLGSGTFKAGSAVTRDFLGAGILLVVGVPKHPVDQPPASQPQPSAPPPSAGGVPTQQAARLTQLLNTGSSGQSFGPRSPRSPTPGHSRTSTMSSPGASRQTFSPQPAGTGPNSAPKTTGAIPCKPVKRPQCVFGAFLGETPTLRHGGHHFFGGRESFAFSFAPEPKDGGSESCSSSSDEDYMSSEDEIVLADGEGDKTSRERATENQRRKEGKCRVYRWSGNKGNENFMVCNHEFLGIGGGDKGAAIFIDSDFQNGTSSTRCTTYDSPVLCGDGDKLKEEHLHQMEFTLQRLIWIKLEGTKFIDVSPSATAKRVLIQSALSRDPRIASPLLLPAGQREFPRSPTVDPIAEFRKQEQVDALGNWVKGPYCRKKRGHHNCDLVPLPEVPYLQTPTTRK